MIIGHQKQWEFLKKCAESGKLSHAYLFLGQEKLGKKTLALEFIKLLNCENPGLSPCQTCRSCQDIQKRQHPDLTMVEPEKKAIQISQIRDLSWKLSLRPYSASFKAAIIDQAHSMNQEAQSCFLKTLEEPKGKALLILITEYPEMLFPTILSRVQKIKFYPVKKTEVEEYLKSQAISEKESEQIGELCLGKPGLAVDFVKLPQKLEIQKQKIEELTFLTSSDLASRFQYAKEITRQSQNLKETLDIWLKHFRGILLSKIHGKEDENFRHYPLNKLRNILKLVQSTNFLISTTNVNPRLALEILMLEL